MTRISTKLWWVLLGSLVGTMLLTGALVTQNQTAILRRQLDYDGKSLARTLADIAVEPAIAEDWLRLQDQIAPVVRGNRQVVFIHVFDDAGVLRAAFPPERETHVAQAGVTEIECPIMIAIDDLPRERRGTIRVGLSSARLDELAFTSAVKVAAGTLIAFSLLAVALWFFLRRYVVLPLAALDVQVATLSNGDLTQPIMTDRDDEIGRLQKTIEVMRSNLKNSYSCIEKQVVALKDLDRMKDEFLANTSHELKTPLNGILGLGESLLMSSYGDLTEEQAESVKLMVTCANRLWKLTDSILRFSRLHREGLEEVSTAEPHFIADHLQEALADLQASAEKEGTKLVLTIPKDLQLTYPRDEVEQILRIFVDNAVKYTPGGIVMIVAQKWQEGSQQGFQIGVRDNGRGIPPELHEKIFEPFVQGFSHETRTHGGVGLGLAIAATLAQRLRARIVLDSDVGKGSTFSLLLSEGSQVVEDLRTAYEPWPPLSQSIRIFADKGHALEPPVTTSPLLPAPAAARGGAALGSYGHVLVVDDESVNREVIWQALRDTHQVTRVADGAMALDVLRSTPVDLVLLDIMMPGMSGYHVLDEMRREGLLERVPVIMLSAKTSKDAVVKGLELGASDYIGKPFHRAELLCRVRAHLEIKRQRDQLRLEVTAKADALEIAELSSKVKSQFLANVSHELRTPLNGIVGFIDLFSTLECTDEQVECLRNLQDKAGDLVEVVDDILDVAKIEARNVAAQIRRAVPSEIFERAVSQYRLAAQTKGLEFRSAWEPGPVPAVHTDAPKVQKIIEILLDNAVKFTGEGWIEATGTVRPHGDGRVALTIQVRDTGIGIPETKQEQVFEPFSQVDGSSTRNFGGMGLGLSLGRLYARLLGGDLTVESAPGKGSTFRATIVAEIGDPGSSRPRERVEATSAP